MPNVLSETVGTSVGEIFTLMVTVSETVGASTLVGIAMPDPLSETDGASVTEIGKCVRTDLSEIAGASNKKDIHVLDVLSETVGESDSERVIVPISETVGASVTKTGECVKTGSSKSAGVSITLTGGVFKLRAPEFNPHKLSSEELGLLRASFINMF